MPADWSVSVELWLYRCSYPPYSITNLSVRIRQNIGDQSYEPLFILFQLQASKKKLNSLFTPWKRMGGVEVSLHAFITSPLDGGEWSASLPGHPTLAERTLLPIEKEVGWSTEQIRTFWRIGKCSLNKWVQDDRIVYLHVSYMFQSCRTLIRLYM